MERFPWYENAIEPEIRELVWRLRNNGINTTCSCGHNMYVQAEYMPDEQLKVMHGTVYNFLAEKEEFFNYTIEIHLNVSNGVLMGVFAEIRILPETRR